MWTQTSYFGDLKVTLGNRILFWNKIVPSKWSKRTCITAITVSLFFKFFKNVFVFNWRIIPLQYCVGFYHASTWISYRYTYVLSLLFHHFLHADEWSVQLPFGVKGKTIKGFPRVDQIAQLKPTWKNRLKSTFQQLSFV